MGAIVFDVVAFREQFPAFQCSPAVSDGTLQAYFDNATLYITNRYNGCYAGMTLAQRTQCLYLMTAHLAAIGRLIAQGQQTGIMLSATVDKVTVSLAPPVAPNQWQYWMQSTPYGAQLLALLQVISTGGFYANPRRVLSAFRT